MVIWFATIEMSSENSIKDGKVASVDKNLSLNSLNILNGSRVLTQS